MSTDGDSLLELTGDPAAAELMRRALRERAEEYAGTPLGDKFSDVLAGRLDVRALADDPEFTALEDRTREAFDEFWAGLDTEQRATMLRSGEERLAEVAEELDA